MCQFRFRRKHELKQHMLSHTGERKFPCKICGKVFHRNATATEHLNSVHYGKRRKKSYTCDLCGQIFVRPKLLRKHLWKLHEKTEYAKEFE